MDERLFLQCLRLQGNENRHHLIVLISQFLRHYALHYVFVVQSFIVITLLKSINFLSFLHSRKCIIKFAGKYTGFTANYEHVNFVCLAICHKHFTLTVDLRTKKLVVTLTIYTSVSLLHYFSFWLVITKFGCTVMFFLFPTKEFAAMFGKNF